VFRQQKRGLRGLKEILSSDLVLHCCGSLPETGFLQGFYREMQCKGAQMYYVVVVKPR
jgi:hypothetical protein